MKTTTNYNLKKPDPTDNIIIADLNTNMDILDSKVKAIDDKASNITVPVTRVNGKIGDVALSAADIKTASGVTVESSLADMTYQIATGTATALIIPMATLVNGYAKTFIASANNNGSATTINGKPLYKPGTTTAPTLILGKAYTVWYNLTGNCFFIKASAEGTTIASHVLEGDTFSNNIDVDIPGAMPNQPFGNQVTSIWQNGTGSLVFGFPTGAYITEGSFGAGLSSVNYFDPNFIASHLEKDISMFGLVGSLTGINPVAGDNIAFSKDTLTSTNNTAYEQASYKMVSNYPGSMRIKFSLRSTQNNTNYPCYGVIFKNGNIIIGTVRSEGRGIWTEFTEDFTCVAGDYFYLGIKCSSYTCEANNVKVCLANTPVSQSY